MISYLQGNERVTPVAMNALFGALNTKLNTLLGGRSFLLANKETGGTGIGGASLHTGVPYSLCGRPFHISAGFTAYSQFTPGALLRERAGTDPVTLLPVTGIGVRSYNHAPFTAAAAAAVPTPVPGGNSTGIDGVNQVATVPAFGPDHYTDGLPVTVGVGLFDHSLEAHREGVTGARHWILEAGTFVPEKRYRYALAEIFIEGVTEADTDVCALEDFKYQCVRAHNLQLVPATLKLPGGFSAALQPLECKSFRVNAAGTAFEASPFRYFFEYRNNDYRQFWFWNTSPNLSTGNAGVTTPAGSMQANNLSNPAVLHDWIQFLTDETGLARHACFHRDVHELCDIGPRYAHVFPAIQG